MAHWWSTCTVHSGPAEVVESLFELAVTQVVQMGLPGERRKARRGATQGLGVAVEAAQFSSLTRPFEHRTGVPRQPQRPVEVPPALARGEILKHLFQQHGDMGSPLGRRHVLRMLAHNPACVRSRNLCRFRPVLQ